MKRRTCWTGNSATPGLFPKRSRRILVPDLCVMIDTNTFGVKERYDQSHATNGRAKIITVEPSGVFSGQYHQYRDELWAVPDPGAKIELGEKTLYPKPGEKLFIPRGIGPPSLMHR